MRTFVRAATAALITLTTLVGATCTSTADSPVTITQQPVKLSIGAKHSAFPSMMLDDGTATLVWRQGSDHYVARDGNIMLSQSDDNGSTWTPAQTVRTGGDHRDPSISRAGGRDWLTWFAGTSSNAAAGTFAQRDQWAPTVRVDGLPYAAMTAPVVELPNGELGATFYGRQAGESYDTCWMAWSRDGKTWGKNRITNMIGSRVHTNEPYLVVDGNLTHMFYRWGTSDGIGMRTSTNSGHTGSWGAPRKILTQASGRPTVLATSGGGLVMVYRKLPTKAAQIAYSSDHGVTWQDGGVLMSPPSGSPNGMTYAAMVEPSPGEVLVVLGMESTAASSALYSARLNVN
jgi:hypothetical protein